MNATVTRERFDGWDCVSLVNDRIAMRIFPELGGRVASLFDRRAGREWLWAPPTGHRFFRNRAGDTFAASTHVGLDECIPTVAPCHWQGRELPDHGEIWALPWAVDAVELDHGIVSMTVDLPITPFRFGRRIQLEADRVRFDYVLHNFGTESEDYLWAMHPLFALQTGDTLELPPDVASLRLECAQGGPVAVRGSVWRWPEPFSGVRLDRMELPDNESGYLKAFAQPRDGKVRLRSATPGSSLMIRWDVAANPCLGLWLTRGGYRGWHHLAIEPSSGAHDQLDLAANSPCRGSHIASQEMRTWWVEWRVAG